MSSHTAVDLDNKRIAPLGDERPKATKKAECDRVFQTVLTEIN
jgi:hypothetical protein